MRLIFLNGASEGTRTPNHLITSQRHHHCATLADKDAIGDLRGRFWIANLLMERGREGKPLYIASPFVFSYIYIISYFFEVFKERALRSANRTSSI